jgi:hypothetical protein
VSADRVLRKGAYFLQGTNGWGSRTCARRMTAAEAAKELKFWETISSHCAIEPADVEPGPDQLEIVQCG